jgi:ABC-type phosphate transport system substrate-binding protein
MPTAQVKNQWGKFVSAGRESLQLAMRAANWEKVLIDQDPTFDMDLLDAGCPGCWPIANVTYVVVPLKGRDGNSLRVLQFFEQALQNGDEAATRESYVPLPTRAKNLIVLAMRRWQGSLDKAGAGKPQRHQ